MDCPLLCSTTRAYINFIAGETLCGACAKWYLGGPESECLGAVSPTSRSCVWFVIWFHVLKTIINQPWLGMVSIPPVFGEFGAGFWHCFTNITMFIGARWCLPHPQKKWDEVGSQELLKRYLTCCEFIYVSWQKLDISWIYHDL